MENMNAKSGDELMHVDYIPLFVGFIERILLPFGHLCSGKD